MTKERSASIMDAIFESPEEDGKGRLLKIMQEFLVSESEKHSAQLKGKLSMSLRLLLRMLTANDQRHPSPKLLSLRMSIWTNWLGILMASLILGKFCTDEF
jgi:hypothetical protein